MSDFKAKIHQIRSRLELRPRPRWGSLQRSPRGPSESFAAGCNLVHCNCFVSILFAMPIPDTFALDVGRSDSIAFALILLYKLQHFGYEKHYLESIILASQLLCSLHHSP